MYPEIHYQIEESRQSGGARTATVFGCYGVSPEIYLPAQIHGVPVTKIGDYGFAKTDEKRSLFIFLPEEEGNMPEERRRLCGELVEEVHLPSQVWEIGRYAFYRCSRLKRLSFTDNLQSIEGGAFTGCQLARLDIACRQTRRTCLRQFLEEQRFELEVRKTGTTWKWHGSISRNTMKRRWRILRHGSWKPTTMGRVGIIGSASITRRSTMRSTIPCLPKQRQGRACGH